MLQLTLSLVAKSQNISTNNFHENIYTDAAYITKQGLHHKNNEVQNIFSYQICCLPQGSDSSYVE